MAWVAWLGEAGGTPQMERAVWAEGPVGGGVHTACIFPRSTKTSRLVLTHWFFPLGADDLSCGGRTG